MLLDELKYADFLGIFLELPPLPPLSKALVFTGLAASNSGRAADA